MKTPALTLMMVFGLLSSAAASGQGGIEMQLNQGRSTLPIFVFEGRSQAGPIDAKIFWTVNGRPVHEGPVHLQGERFLEIRALPLTESSLVCAMFAASIDREDGYRYDLVAQECVDFTPDLGPRRSVLPDPLLHQQLDRPLVEPLDLRPRRLRPAGTR